MQLMRRVGDNLRAVRRRAGLSQIELAKRAGVGPATVARIEAGSFDNPRLKTLQSLARALEVDLRDLVAELDE